MNSPSGFLRTAEQRQRVWVVALGLAWLACTAACSTPHERPQKQNTVEPGVRRLDIDNPSKPEASGETSKATLCNEKERVIFSAAVQGSEKLVSICGSRQLDSRRGYLQYRFGRPGQIEMEFPRTRENTQPQFSYTRYTRPRVTYLTLKFETNGYRYSIHQDHDAEQEPARLEAYVTIASPERHEIVPEEDVLHLRVPVQGSLMNLESVVPNVPWSEASFPASGKPAPGLSPREVLLAAKKVFLVNSSADRGTFDLLQQKLRQWNRWQTVNRRADADLVLFFSADRVVLDGPAEIERPYRDYRYLLAKQAGTRRNVLSVRSEVIGDAKMTAEDVFRQIRQEVEKNNKKGRL